MSKDLDWAWWLEHAESLDAVERHFIRERCLRQIMAETGETHEIVAEMYDAMQSMDQEAVLSLTDGEPTTLADALSRYVADLRQADEGSKVGVDGVINHLEALLAYPWPKDGATA